MTEDELQMVTMRDDFYRDHFGQLVFIIASIIVAIIFLIAISIYIHLHQPKPLVFKVYDEYRVQPSVDLDQPYLTLPDLYQWVTNAVTNSFVFDFLHYNDQLKTVSQFFTDNGWKVFSNQLNNYANYNKVQADRLFVNGIPAGAPALLRPGGLLSGRYAWWIEMPIKVVYSGYSPPLPNNLVLQLLVVRVPTLNNLSGVAIDNVIVEQPQGSR